VDLFTLLSVGLWVDIPVVHATFLAVYPKGTVAKIRRATKLLVGSVVLEAVIYPSETDLSNLFGYWFSIRILC